MAEEYVGIIAANIPCLKSQMEKIFQLFGGKLKNQLSKNSRGRLSSTLQLQESLNGKFPTSMSKPKELSLSSEDGVLLE
jgi:hypothetical protein